MGVGEWIGGEQAGYVTRHGTHGTYETYETYRTYRTYGRQTDNI